MPIDSVRLNFSAESLGLLNAVLALIMFGVALELDLGRFRDVARNPRALLTGMFAVLVVFPLATAALVRVVKPPPSVALGMLLVATSPGGNMSNFLTHLARGNTALSITLTALATVAAVVTTPLMFTLLASTNPHTAELLQRVTLDAGEMVRAFVVLVIVPLLAGRLLAAFLPRTAQRISRPMRLLSIGFFVLFVFLALRANWSFFTTWVGQVAGYVALQDTMALMLGYGVARLARLHEEDRRAIAIECGIRNSGLSLVLIFAFFGGLGGMAITAAWWGIWHIASGLTLAFWWSRRAPSAPSASPRLA